MSTNVDDLRDATKEICCGECGYHRNGAHHPGIRCPDSGRCGECGSDWPCFDHDPNATEQTGCMGFIFGGTAETSTVLILAETEKYFRVRLEVDTWGKHCKGDEFRILKRHVHVLTEEDP